MDMKKNRSWPNTIRIIVFSCLIGGAAGVVGTALTTSYLSEYALQLGQLTQPLRVTQERPRALPESYEEALERLEDRALSAVGQSFKGSLVEEYGVSLNDASSSVIALTSDGWGLSIAGRIGDMAVWGTHICEIDEIIVEPMFGFQFVHCATSSVPVVDIAGGYGVSAGDQLFVVTSQQAFTFTYATSIVWGDSVRSSDVPSRRILLADEGAQLGSAVFNVFGELVGVVDENSEVIVFEHLSGAFNQVLQGAAIISYPALGVRGVDLARSAAVSEEVSQGLHAGFVLYGTRAVEWGSAGFDAGLLVKDIVLSVDGVSINRDVSMDDLIANYAPGDQIQIEIDRGGSRQEVSVTLGELEI
jgi:hypothetical protein